MAAGANPVRNPGLGSVLQDTEHVAEQMETYNRHFQGNDAESTEKRLTEAASLSSRFHTLVTDFYEYGFGESFHFCPLFRGRRFEDCIADCEMYVAGKAKAGPGKKVADFGCGVGGPSNRIGKVFRDMEIVGLNICEYQLKKAISYAERDGLDKVSFMKADYHNVPLKDSTFDAVYDFEAICHSRSLATVYSEAFRILKPGGMFVVEDWFMTDKYNPNNPTHQKIKRKIEECNGIADLQHVSVGLKAMETAGFEVLEHSDRGDDGDEPWYAILSGRSLCSLQSFRASWIGRMTTHMLVVTMETVGLAPRGSTSVHSMLLGAADCLIDGGRTGIFTPLYTIVARKPVTAKN